MSHHLRSFDNFKRMHNLPKIIHIFWNDCSGCKPVELPESHQKTLHGSTIKRTIYCENPICIKCHPSSNWGQSNAMLYVAHWLPPCIIGYVIALIKLPFKLRIVLGQKLLVFTGWQSMSEIIYCITLTPIWTWVTFHAHGVVTIYGPFDNWSM